MKNNIINLIAAVIISIPLFMIALEDLPQTNKEGEPLTAAILDPGQPGGG
ncbi:hypothetical protein AB1K91_17730 [Terribacillus sp. 179-K 1B1 HS]